MISKNQSNLLPCELWVSQTYTFQEIRIFLWCLKKEMFFEFFWKHWDRVLQGSLPFSTGRRISKLEHLLMSCLGKDLQLPFKISSQPPQIKFYSAHREVDVVPPSPISTGKFCPRYQSWPQTPHKLSIEVTPCFTDTNTSYISLLCRHTEVISIFNAQQ